MAGTIEVSKVPGYIQQIFRSPSNFAWSIGNFANVSYVVSDTKVYYDDQLVVADGSTEEEETAPWKSVPTMLKLQLLGEWGNIATFIKPEGVLQLNRHVLYYNGKRVIDFDE